MIKAERGGFGFHEPVARHMRFPFPEMKTEYNMPSGLRCHNGLHTTQRYDARFLDFDESGPRLSSPCSSFTRSA